MPLMEMIGKVVDAILEYTPLGNLLKEIDKAAGTDLSSMVKAMQLRRSRLRQLLL